MAEITAEMVKQLREATNAGVLDCKKALTETNGDFEAAVEILRKKGLATAAKKAGREANEGLIGSYVHPGSKIASLVEVNCETDFVARTEEFQQLARDLAMHVTASRPQYISREDVPADVIAKEREIYRAEVSNSGKPAEVIERIVDGKLEKWFEEVCLLEQPFIKDPQITIKDLLTSRIASLGENIKIRRFCRFEVGAE
ncbi:MULTISPECIES: translation elongation factor Ts [Caldilinea]|jgi:elongation factor Ts|uniref:Elongation factor Ts n=1 Tax=Caldilinea aerophila (strain DSM 14535 / JCM 11387 / NBRC 104270 / STL-6-O1) TaxID=926550 RepID=I0IA63_CALAS|nr:MULTISPECIES: translation elongation factor Ts [Caldilinea]MBO9391329.1 translation elongation factor Ts [Caldilinea sp.]BAM02151.1 elongation factor Ts [Caldilinea aerophila DSM 14535 = NBRC 104270]GIV75350.1 MAG: elongation factor Ts [Caldilinea sp.]